MSEVTSTDTHAYPRLLSLAVHELRSPASVVGGYLRMLQSGMGGDLSDPQRKMVGEAEKSCARIVALIAELSDIGKMDAGTVTLNETLLDVFTLVDEVASDMQEAEDRAVQLRVQGIADGAWLRGDRPRLTAAFSVFFRAILREQPSATTVVIDKRLDNKAGSLHATIVVAREDAVQETYDAMAAPFDEFRGGLGLGLPLARRIIERSNGRVWTPGPVERDRQGLVISLPVHLSHEE